VRPLARIAAPTEALPPGQGGYNLSKLLGGLVLLAFQAAPMQVAPAPDWKWIVPLVLFFLVQSGSFLWWAASLTTTVKHQVSKTDRMEQAIERLSDVNTRIGHVEVGQEDHEARLRKLEGG
jgi:membrane protein implicated in regulation of membrane protease activity